MWIMISRMKMPICGSINCCFYNGYLYGAIHSRSKLLQSVAKFNNLFIFPYICLRIYANKSFALNDVFGTKPTPLSGWSTSLRQSICRNKVKNYGKIALFSLLTFIVSKCRLCSDALVVSSGNVAEWTIRLGNCRKQHSKMLSTHKREMTRKTISTKRQSLHRNETKKKLLQRQMNKRYNVCNTQKKHFRRNCSLLPPSKQQNQQSHRICFKIIGRVKKPAANVTSQNHSRSCVSI